MASVTTKGGNDVTAHLDQRRRLLGVPLACGLAAVLVLAACGSDNSGSTSAPTTASSAGASATTATSSGASATTAAGGASATTAAASTDWQNVVSAAKKEGSVTIYSSQGLDQLNDFASKFEKKYGIHVDVVRGVDGDLNTKVEAEKQTRKGIADMWVSASQSTIQTKADQGGWFVPAAGPDFDAAAYNKTTNSHKGDYFEVGAAVLTFGWNTQSTRRA